MYFLKKRTSSKELHQLKFKQYIEVYVSIMCINILQNIKAVALKL
jgi:hypothetical protein